MSYSNSQSHGTSDDDIAERRRRQISSRLNARDRRNIPGPVGDPVFFWRKNDGWTGPATVTRIGEFDVDILHNGKEKIAAKYRICHPPQRIPTSELEAVDTNREATPEWHAHESVSHTLVKPNLNAKRTPSRSAKRSEAECLVKENRNMKEQLPSKRTATLITCPHEIAYVSNCQLASPSIDLMVEEKIVVYQKEKMSWSENCAYERVGKRDVDTVSNIIGCHITYRRKPDGAPRARIVLWGHKNVEEDSVRGDAPSQSLDALRLTVSVAAERSWTVKKMDVKTVDLQARDFNRDISVRPPK